MRHRLPIRAIAALVLVTASGTISVGGRDVTSVPVEELRRDIGYVIQQVGLFPHRTIAQNIATVPKLLRWSKPEITERVEELVDLVGRMAREGFTVTGRKVTIP